MNVLPGRGPIGLGEPLPSGTVTFAFTDIEGSAQRWERDPSAMQRAVRRHDELMRLALAAHGGHVFKTVGDAFCAAFSRPEDALAGALAAQRALTAEDFTAVGDLRVRAAIHTGSADERDGDYFGPTVNRVARLLAIAHGRQVLVSRATSDLVHDTLPPQTTLRDLGEHRLKDLTRPERVYQLLASDLVADFPPLRSLGVLPNNLPAALTSFVGRESEIAQITALLGTHRLVTLVGSGGIGKTRTSLQVAANLVDGSDDGVWFIELAPLTVGDYISSTIAQVMRLPLAADGDPVENLVRALKAKRTVLVFDNCEHLLEAAARVVAALLRDAPGVKVLASSRQGLGIGGEQTYRLPSLELPVRGSDVLAASDAGHCEAITLFVERARAVDQRFTLTDENAPIIADICRRLDGIPLAIELAAARVSILSPRQLRERLDERFAVLTGGGRDALPRQQTLRALIDWSHDMLDERERALFRRLGIFVNGFELEGAVAVGCADGLGDVEAFDGLTSLVDKSLVLAEPSGDALRYRLLESTRIYAGEKLAAAGERDRCASRHLRYLRDRFNAGRERFELTARWAELDDLLATELEDVRAALAVALNGTDVVLGGEMLADIGHQWGELGLDNEGLTRIQTFLTALPHGEPRLLARLWIALALIAWDCGRFALRFEAAAQAVAHARSCGDAATLAGALLVCSLAEASPNSLDAAETALREAEAIGGASAALRLRLTFLRAASSAQRGDLATAARIYEQLYREHRRIGNESVARLMMLNLAETEHERGRTQRAVALVREELPASRTHSDRGHLVLSLLNLAGYLAALGDLTGSLAAAREAIRELAMREPDSTHVAIAIEHLALALALGGELPRAVALAGAADAAFRRHAYEREFTETTTRDRLAAILRERIAPDQLSRLLSEGAALAPDAAVALALEEP